MEKIHRKYVSRKSKKTRKTKKTKKTKRYKKRRGSKNWSNDPHNCGGGSYENHHSTGERSWNGETRI